MCTFSQNCGSFWNIFIVRFFVLLLVKFSAPSSSECLATLNICQTRKNNGHLLSNFQRPRRLNQALKYETTKAKKLLNLILSSYLRTLDCGRHRSVRILFLIHIYIFYSWWELNIWKVKTSMALKHSKKWYRYLLTTNQVHNFMWFSCMVVDIVVDMVH